MFIISIIINLGILFTGILTDPGVKESIYIKYSKQKYDQNED